jgi:chromosome segregation ATPase
MLKHVSINRFEGTGIIERIEGNGWDIDADSIELNGVNARINECLENRTISLNGPAVEDLFKSLQDLLKENGRLRENIEMKKARIRILNKELLDKNFKIDVLNNSLSNYYELSEKCSILENSDSSVNYCTNDVLATETLYLRQTIEEQDECIRHLENGLKEKDIAIKVLQLDKDRYKERCEILERSIEEKNDHINMLDKLLGEWNPIKDFIRETTGDDIDFAVKTFLHFIPDYEVTVSVSRQEDDDNG